MPRHYCLVICSIEVSFCCVLKCCCIDSCIKSVRELLCRFLVTVSCLIKRCPDLKQLYLMSRSSGWLALRSKRVIYIWTIYWAIKLMFMSMCHSTLCAWKRQSCCWDKNWSGEQTGKYQKCIFLKSAAIVEISTITMKKRYLHYNLECFE